ncbi:LysR family transcriptional regulator [Nakamurella endophytica]|uniref:LysR family transcriptional regulator n=1 Tax=Nakamurella endophytica TaxID=1748367 RepID=A0A917T072_9ACTN|nr:LysR family transcriptional regulator [Nakamurella endophytica]GGM06182.1 LysR family transcriptional regulator [Nakamurella endophytica]
MIDLRRLEILRELDRCGTIAATAQAVHLTPSAVSQQLAALSREAGTAMLEPDGRRVRLTAAAQLLLSHAHEVFTHLEHAESDLAAFRRGDAGTVRLGSFASAVSSIVVPVLRTVAERSRLQVYTVEVQPEGAADALLGRSVDLALTLSGEPPTADDDARLHVEPLLTDVLDVALPVGHPLAAGPAVDLADLADEPWIVNIPGTPCWQVAVSACARAGFTPRVQHRADEFTGVIALVSAGAGIALLPRLAQDVLPQAPVVLRPVAGVSPVRHIGVQYRAGTAAQPHIAPVLTALREVCAALARCAPGAQRQRLTAVATASA